MGSRRKPQIEDSLESIDDLVKARGQLARKAEQQYASEVEDLVQTECRDAHRIEHLLDGILDFCFDPEVLRLYKKLCRYYLAIDPEATAFYVNSYREMWDEAEERNQGEK